jgi:MATE family multidrug resistance protein
MTLAFSVMMLMFFIPLSYGYAISALVGSALGSGYVEKAKRIVIITMFLSSFTMLVVSVTVYCNLERIISIYCDESETKEVYDLAVSNLGAYTMIYFLDGIQVNLQATIKGLGLQEKAQFISLLSFFIIGLPCSYLCGITFKYGLNGLWYGFAVGLIFLVILYSLLLIRTDWNSVSTDIRKDIRR